MARTRGPARPIPVEVVHSDLLDSVSALGSGTRVIAVWPQAGGERAGHALRLPRRGRRPRERRGDHPHRPRAPRRDRRARSRLRRRRTGRRPPGRAWARSSPGRPRPSPRSGRRRSRGPPSSPTVARGSTRLAGAATLCLGSERDGLRPEVLAACAASATIPLHGGAESLNVAAAAAVACARMSRGARPCLSRSRRSGSRPRRRSSTPRPAPSWRSCGSATSAAKRS